METIYSLWISYWIWWAAHPIMLWFTGVALVLLYVFVENYGQPWMRDDFEDNDLL